MELIAELSDFENEKEQNEQQFRLREATRGIFFDENNNIPILFVKKYNYHKLPGGGMDPGETVEQALHREILEEVGSEIEIEKKIGKIIEYRKKYNLKQISYCYIGKILSKGKQNFTQKELDHGFELIWVKLENAIELISNDNPFNYEGQVIQKRDLKILQESLKLI